MGEVDSAVDNADDRSCAAPPRRAGVNDIGARLNERKVELFDQGPGAFDGQDCIEIRKPPDLARIDRSRCYVSGNASDIQTGFGQCLNRAFKLDKHDQVGHRTRSCAFGHLDTKPPEFH